MHAEGWRVCAVCCAGCIGGRILEVLEALEVSATMYCMLICMMEAIEGGLSFRVSKFPLWQFSRYSPPPI